MKIIKFKEYISESLSDTPETYVSSLLGKLKNKIDSFFESSESAPEDQVVRKIGQVRNDDRREGGGMSFKDLGLTLNSSEISKYSKVYDSLKIIFSDEKARYDLVIIIDLKDALPKDNPDFNIDDIKDCTIKFKKYDLDEDFKLVGQLSKTIKVKDIDEELLIDLKLELDKMFGSDDEEGLEIETE